MSERLRQIAEERNRFLRGMAGGILKMHDELLGTNYMAPKPTLWQRFWRWMPFRFVRWKAPNAFQEDKDEK